MALRVLRVLSVNSRQQIGTIELPDDGELHAAPRGARRALDELHLPPSDQERRTAENGIAHAGTVLKVLGVRSGALIGTIELTDSGELRGSPPAVLDDVKRMAAARGRSPQEAFEDLNGWSNGYVQIVASEDQES